MMFIWNKDQDCLINLDSILQIYAVPEGIGSEGPCTLRGDIVGNDYMVLGRFESKAEALKWVASHLPESYFGG
jgi:hypothetical protein